MRRMREHAGSCRSHAGCASPIPSGLLHVLVTVATPIDDGASQIVQFCIRSDREEEVSAADAIAFETAR